MNVTVPGVSDWATCSAVLRTGAISLIDVTLTQYLHRGLNKDIWSISWRAPLPFNIVAAAPPIRKCIWHLLQGKRTNKYFRNQPNNKIGDSAIWAFLMAVTVFVNPGPAVTATVPTVPVILATASAANTAETYSREDLSEYHKLLF